MGKRCSSCLTTHGARLRLLSGNPAWADRVARDFRRVGMDVRTRVMLECAVKLTRWPGAVSAKDLARLRRHGLSDEPGWDVLQTAAMFNFTNRLAIGSGVRPNPEYRRMGRARVRSRPP